MKFISLIKLTQQKTSTLVVTVFYGLQNRIEIALQQRYTVMPPFSIKGPERIRIDKYGNISINWNINEIKR